MAKKNIVEDLDLEIINEEEVRELPKQEEVSETPKRKVNREDYDESGLVNCLSNTKVIVRHLPKESMMVTNPKHVLYGGMAETTTKSFTVPQLESGALVNVLTNKEKEYLEYAMGLEFNALSVHRKENNYWKNIQVRLQKQDNILMLSDPEQYIKYKILLANKDDIAPSLQVAQDKPKATYKFVIIKEGEENTKAKKEMSATMQSYMEFGKVQEDKPTLKTIIETIDGRPVSPNSKLEELQTRINKLIIANPNLFLKIITDPLLPNKVLLRQAVEARVVVDRGGYFYLREDGSPLCEKNEDPMFSVAARFIGLPKNQTIKFMLEARIKE